MSNKKKLMTIAIAAEITPAKTIIPIIKKIKLLESKNKLNWENSKIIGLYHGDSVKNILSPFCDECFSLYDFYFAVSCNSLPNFTKKPFFLMALANFDLSVLLRAF